MRAIIRVLRLGLLAACLGLLLAACGGGGGGGGGSTTPPASTPVSFTGSVAPPPGVSPAPPVVLVNSSGTPPSDMLLPNGAPLAGFPAIAQSAQYINSAALPAVKVTSVNFQALAPGAYVQPSMGGFGIATNPPLGQLVGIAVVGNALPMTISPNTAISSIDNDTFPQPSHVLSIVPLGGVGAKIAGYAVARSTELGNPNGFIYSTFGGWTEFPSAGVITDGYFSLGVPTTVALPASGMATYTGPAEATYVNTSGDTFDMRATVTAQVDFATRMITLTTSATTTLPTDAPPSVLPSANPSLNLSALLSFPIATNTFTGATAGNTGNFTGRFYGPAVVSGTASKPAGSPSEIGGTLALIIPGVGSVVGSFGAQ